MAGFEVTTYGRFCGDHRGTALGFREYRTKSGLAIRSNRPAIAGINLGPAAPTSTLVSPETTVSRVTLVEGWGDDPALLYTIKAVIIYQ
jgi:hypothetical protein